MFRRKVLGFFDPLNMFLLMRMTPMLASIILFSVSLPLTLNLVLFIGSASLFIVTLYLTSPKIKITRVVFDERTINFFLRMAVLILFIKTAILISATGSLPIFSDGGSDAYIGFDTDNKLGSSFLLGLGGADVVLFSFSIPLINKFRKRILFVFLLFIAIIIGMSAGKKSSMFGLFSSVAFGEYLRVYLLTNQNKFFLKPANIYLGLTLAVFFAAWTYTKTVGTYFELPDANMAFLAIDFAMYQWAYPFMLFVSGELNTFFQGYQVNQFAYFFHSILSPLGFPVFTSSIGPSINEYLTGGMTGNGINPTFIIEGYVLSGVFVPIYAILAGYFVGKGRAYLMKIKSIEYKVALSALFLPALYAFAIDGLLFAKMFYVILFIFFLVIIPLRFLSYAAK